VMVNMRVLLCTLNDVILQQYDPPDDPLVWERSGLVWGHWRGPSPSTGAESSRSVSVTLFLSTCMSVFHTMNKNFHSISIVVTS
jgi:hypothetical protein